MPVENSLEFKIIREPTSRPGLKTNHEADTIVTAQAIILQQEEKNKANDTDIYVPLQLHHFLDRGLNIPMVTQSPKKSRARKGFGHNC